MSIVVVSGASGFIGQAVCLSLAKAGYSVKALSRKDQQNTLHKNIEWLKVSFVDTAELSEILKGSYCLIHLADDPNRHTKGNYQSQLTKMITLSMLEVGLKKIIFSSSIYARLALEGEPSQYGQQKLVSEDTLLKSGNLDPVILRLPPVYGLGSKGGIALLTKLIEKNVPLPLGQAKELRDYISLSNIASLITHLIGLNANEWSKIQGRIFEPSDGNPISGIDLCKELGTATNKKVILISIPYKLLATLANIIRKKDLVDSVFRKIEVKTSPSLYSLCGWQPHEKIPKSLKYLSHR